MILLELYWVCLQTSILSFGGVHGALPEWQRVFVSERGWVSSAQLLESYVVGQLAPGPSMVVAVLLGRQVAGISGACAAFLGTYTAPIALALCMAGLLRRVQEVSWVRRVEVALRPLVLGFMGAAALSIMRAQLTRGVLPLVIVGSAAALTYARGLLGPVPILLASGLAYCALTALLAQL